MVAHKPREPETADLGAQSLFAAFLEDEPESKTDDLEELCGRHSKHAQDLREMWSKHREVDRLIQGAIPGVDESEAAEDLPACAGGGVGAARNHLTLGQILLRRERYAEAQAAFERALEGDPHFALAHCFLGHALSGQGQHRAALAHMRTGHERGSSHSSWSKPSEEWLRILETEVRWQDLVEGRAESSDAQELVWVARVCYGRQRYATAIPFYVRAFELDLATSGGYQFNAACTATLAAAGAGISEPAPGAGEFQNLRAQALSWLERHLSTLTKIFDQGRAPYYWLKQMREWRDDPDLARVRELDHLARLGEEERRGWERLWRDVDALVDRIAM